MRVDVDDRIHSLESELARLSRAVDEMQSRLARLEQTLPPRAEGAHLHLPAAEADEAPSTATRATGGLEIAPNVAAAGRLLLVLGGAYLLRAFTEAGILPEALGVTAGLVYAFFWLGMASRAGASGSGLQAGFHAASALVVAYPLLWETTARRELLSAPWSAFFVLLVAVTGLGVGVRHRLRATAWLSVGAASIVTLALMVGTRELAPFALGSVAVAIATLALTRPTTLPYLSWLAALTADLTVAIYAIGNVVARDETAAGTALGPGLAAQLALVIASIYFFATRVLVEEREPSWFMLAQTLAALGLGFAAAVFTAPEALSVALAVTGALVGAWLFALAERRSLSVAGAAYLTGTGIALVFLALLRLVPSPGLALALAGLGVALSVLGSRKEDALLPLYGAFFLIAAAVASGAVTRSLYALAAPAADPWPSFRLGSLVVLIASAAAYSLCGPSERLWISRARLAATLDLTLTVLVAGGAVVAGVSALFGGFEPGTLAVVRTGVLAVAAVVLGLAGRRYGSSRPELRRLQYPVLVLGALKLLVEDVPNGGSDRLFISLALYGTALILASRLARR